MTLEKKTKPRTRRSRKTRLDLDGQLAKLENYDLVRRLAETELAYLFKHSLTQETAYESLLLKTRREIHLRVAQSYERFYPDRLDEFAAMLAQHYGEAGDGPKTLEYEIRAGDVAARQYANAEAIGHYASALKIALRQRPVDLALVQETFRKHGRSLELSGRYAEALSNYEQMEIAGRELGDRALELASLVARATLLATPTPVFNPARAPVLLEQALALARDQGDAASEAKALWNLMLINKFTNHPRKAKDFGEQALAIARKHNLREQMAFTLNDLAMHAYFDVGAFGDALRVLDEAKWLWVELDNQPMLADTLTNFAQIYSLRGDFDEAIQASHEARGISEKIGNLWGQSYSRFVEGDVQAERGDVERAIILMEQCIALGEKAGFLAPSIWVRSNLASLYGWLGQVEEGVQLAHLARQSAEGNLVAWWAFPLAVAARLELSRGRMLEAEEDFAEIKSEATPNYLTELMVPMGAAISMALIELELARGDLPSAETEVRKLLARTEETGARNYHLQALFLESKIELARGRQDERRETLLKAKAAAEELVSRKMLWRILAALSKIELERGNGAAAEELASQSQGVVRYIAEHSPPKLRESFLNLKEVREIMCDP